MKKILIGIILGIVPIQAFAYTTIHTNQLAIGKLEDIKNEGKKTFILLNNFTNFNIYNPLTNLSQYNYFINKYIEIENFPEDLKINKGDIVSIAKDKGYPSPGILKITCSKEGKTIVEGTVNKFFGTSKEIGFRNDIKLANKIDETIGCENLETFFMEDRRLQDLDGEHAIYDYRISLTKSNYLELFFSLGIITFLIFGFYKITKRLRK